MPQELAHPYFHCVHKADTKAALGLLVKGPFRDEEAVLEQSTATGTGHPRVIRLFVMVHKLSDSRVLFRDGMADSV